VVNVKKLRSKCGHGVESGVFHILADEQELKLDFFMNSIKLAMFHLLFPFGKREKDVAKMLSTGGGDMFGGTPQSHSIGTITMFL
jgi:hypothetical protein